MRMRLPRVRTFLIVLALSVAMFAGGVLVTRSGPAPATPQGRVSSSEIVATPTSGDLAETISALQQQLRRLPGDHPGWSALGTAYVAQAAVTGDPTYYPKAQGALGRSLRIEPHNNAAALTGLAALAAARHDFAGALRQARAAQRINPYSAANQGILSDALQQLGRYGDARTELQRMLDLQPSVPSFTRASYAWELQGELGQARRALQRALELATRPSDVAYCLYYLGELAWNAGQLDRADRSYARGLRLDPSYTQLLAGRAKVAAARGEISLAMRRYEEVVARLPVPTYLIAYADLLRAEGRSAEVARQEAVIAATQSLFESEGVNVDLELAVYHADRGDGAAALAAARSAWQVQRSIEAADAYGWALHAAGRDREALPYARAAARLGTLSAPFAYHRGLIERALGLDTAAEASLRRALDINPAFSPLQAPRARAALAGLAAR